VLAISKRSCGGNHRDGGSKTIKSNLPSTALNTSLWLFTLIMADAVAEPLIANNLVQSCRRG
jgi:hypothetical protein